MKRDDSLLFYITFWISAAIISGVLSDLILIYISIFRDKTKKIPPNPQFFIYMLPDDITPINKDTIVTRFNFFKDLYANNAAANYIFATTLKLNF